MARLTYRVAYALGPFVQCGNWVNEPTTDLMAREAGCFVLAAGAGHRRALGSRGKPIDRGRKIRSEGKKVVRQPCLAEEPNCRFDVTLPQKYPLPKMMILACRCEKVTRARKRGGERNRLASTCTQDYLLWIRGPAEGHRSPAQSRGR